MRSTVTSTQAVVGFLPTKFTAPRIPQPAHLSASVVAQTYWSELILKTPYLANLPSLKASSILC